jgi:hypothetical protein
VTFLLSPISGLIPAIACSGTQPKKHTLNYPKEDLMQKKEFAKGYIDQAWNIKQTQVWTNWAFGFAFNLLLVLFIASQNK